MATQIAGEIPSFDLKTYTDKPIKTKRISRQTQLATAAIRMALNDCGASLEMLARNGDLPIYLGSGTSSLGMLEEGFTSLLEKGPRRVSPFLVGSSTPHSAASFLGEHLGLPACLTTFSTACASGLAALSAAAHRIRSGQSDLVFAGATDAPVTPFGVAGFANAKMTSRLNDDPQHASRPFDMKRDGGLLSEGAAILVLEQLEHALARDATIYAEVLGSGMNSDRPGQEPASGLKETMDQALKNSRLLPDHIDCINAHGTSDKVMDRVECGCIEDVFSSTGRSMPITSIKGVTGNPLAAGGALQLVTASLMLQRQCIPPTTNHEFHDPECRGDIVHGDPREHDLHNILINAHGFGGVNISLILSEVPR